MGRTTEEFYDSSIRDIIKQIRIHIKVQKERQGLENNKGNESKTVKGEKMTYMKLETFDED